MKKISKSVSDTVTCEHCHSENEVMFYPSYRGQPDPNQSNCCPPEEASHQPTHCTVCGEELLIETDADQINQDAYEAAMEAKGDEMREERGYRG